MVDIFPSTDLGPIISLLNLPARRQVRARLEVNEHIVRGLRFLSRDLNGSADSRDSVWKDDKVFDLGVLHHMTNEQLKVVIQSGFIPILQRLIVSPEEIPTSNNWLTRAAMYAAMKADETLRLAIPGPIAVREAETDNIGPQIVLHGCDMTDEKPRPWQISRVIDPPTSIKDQIPLLPFQDRIDWQGHSQTDFGEDELHAFRCTQQYRLAQWLTFSLSGSVGVESDVVRKLDMLLIRLTKAPESSVPDLTVADACDRIHAIVPWRVSEWHASLQPHLQDDLLATVRDVRTYEIECDSEEVSVWVEALNAMLVQLTRGATIDTIFEAGKRYADFYGRSGAPAMDPQPPCMEEIRDNHWHTCAGCLKPWLCLYFEDSLMEPPNLMLCMACEDSDMAVGWQLREDSD